jgi:hypothetical protein
MLNMELERKVKTAFTILSNDLKENEFIVVTKNKAFYKTDNYEFSDNTWSSNNNIDVLTEAGLQQQQQQQPVKRTPNASQEMITNKIKDFFNENKWEPGKDKEDFNGISVNCQMDVAARKKFLSEKILPSLKGKASSSLYRTFIQLVLLIKKYKLSLDDKENDEYGEEILKTELGSLLKTTEKPYLYLKKVKNFYTLVSMCKKNTWKDCIIPPSYWRDIDNDHWSELLESLNLNNYDIFEE